MVFEFYWSWYEEHMYFLMEAEDKTQAQFSKDCEKAMIESFDEYMGKLDYEWASLKDWVAFASVKMEDYGYKIVEPIKFGYFGFYLPKKEDLEYLSEDADLSSIKEQIKKIAEYNDEFENKII